MEDGIHIPVRAIDGTEGGYWASEPGDKICTYNVMFPKPYALGEIIIDWKWPPSVFDFDLLKESWVTV